MLEVECGLDLLVGGLWGPQEAAPRELVGPEEGWTSDGSNTSGHGAPRREGLGSSLGSAVADCVTLAKSPPLWTLRFIISRMGITIALSFCVMMTMYLKMTPYSPAGGLAPRRCPITVHFAVMSLFLLLLRGPRGSRNPEDPA